MVVRVAERARLSGALQVLIATDSPRVVDVAKEHGFEALLTRADHPNGTDRLAEVATHFGWSDDTIVVNVQGDEPLIDPALVRNVAAHLAAHPSWRDCDRCASHPRSGRCLQSERGESRAGFEERRAVFFARADSVVA